MKQNHPSSDLMVCPLFYDMFLIQGNRKVLDQLAVHSVRESLSKIEQNSIFARTREEPVFQSNKYRLTKKYHWSTTVFEKIHFRLFLLLSLIRVIPSRRAKCI